MRNAENIKEVAKQMIGVCNVIINLAEAEESELYDEMLWDELAHTQKLVLEFTRYAFDEEEDADGSAEEAETEEVVGEEPRNFDDAFFAGELDGKLGDKTEDDAIIIDVEDDETVPSGIDK